MPGGCVAGCRDVGKDVDGGRGEARVRPAGRAASKDRQQPGVQDEPHPKKETRRRGWSLNVAGSLCLSLAVPGLLRFAGLLAKSRARGEARGDKKSQQLEPAKAGESPTNPQLPPRVSERAGESQMHHCYWQQDLGRASMSQREPARALGRGSQRGPAKARKANEIQRDPARSRESQPSHLNPSNPGARVLLPFLDRGLGQHRCGDGPWGRD